MRVGSLFSGCGGLDLAFAGVGFELGWLCEVDRSCNLVLDARFSGVVNLGDVRGVDWGRVDGVDVVLAGFPCQPVSVAGAKLGSKDERWLWPEVVRAVSVLRPRFVVLENVAGILRRGAQEVFGDLAGIGFDAWWCCFNASDVGAPHRRRRWFCVAWDAVADSGGAGAGGFGGKVFGEEEQFGWWGQGDADASGVYRGVVADSDSECGVEWGVAGSGEAAGGGPSAVDSGCVGEGVAAVADPDGSGCVEYGGAVSVSSQVGSVECGGGEGVEWGRYESAIRRWERVLGRCAPRPVDARGRLDPDFVEWMMGFPLGHTDVDGVSRAARLRMLGNAVCVQQGMVVANWLSGGFFE